MITISRVNIHWIIRHWFRAWVCVGLNTKFALAAHNICFEAPDENVGMDFLKHTEIRLNENGEYELDEDEQEQEQDVDNALEIENELEEKQEQEQLDKEQEQLQEQQLLIESQIKEQGSDLSDSNNRIPIQITDNSRSDSNLDRNSSELDNKNEQQDNKNLSNNADSSEITNKVKEIVEKELQNSRISTADSSLQHK
ncbi:MAG: hypothetical protein EZS28_053212, partial [Streblomastix strix]